MIALLLAGALLQDLEALLRDLGAERPETRAEARSRIKALGPTALPRLDEAARGRDPEVASQARRLGQLIRLAEREKLPAGLAGLDEALLDRGPTAWIDALETRNPDDAAWQFLASRAATHARSDDDRRRVSAALDKRPGGADGLLTWFTPPPREAEPSEPPLREAVELLRRLGARRELFQIVSVHGRFDPKESPLRRIDPNRVSDAFRALVELKAVDEIRAIANQKGILHAADACEALADLDIRAAIPELLEKLSSDEGWIRHHAARGLGRLGVREAVPGLLKLLDDPVGPARRGAAEALGLLGAVEAVPRLTALVDDPRSWVQVVAMRSLVSLKAGTALPALRKASTHADPAVRAAAFESLLRLNPKEDVTAALEDDKPVVRAYAAAELCRGGSRKGVAALLRLAEMPVELHLNVGDEWSGGGVELPSPPLFVLNGARSPELWTRLGGRTLSKDAAGVLGPDLEQFAAEAGLSLDLAPGIDRSLRYFHIPVPRGKELRKALDDLAVCSTLAVILDGPRLRVLPQPEGLADWKRWWTDQGGGDPAYEKRRRSIDTLLTPGLKKHLDRLAGGDDAAWAALGIELLDKDLAVEDRALLFEQGMRTASSPAQKAKLLKLGGEADALTALQDPAWELRAAALARLDPAKHAAAIFSKAGDPSTDVARLVLQAAQSLKTPETLDVLKLLSLHHDWQLSDQATLYLSFRDEPALIPHMIGRLETAQKNFGSAQFALGFLGRQGARESVPEILKLLDDPRASCRQEAYRAIVELGAREALPRVLAVVRRSPEELRSALPLLQTWKVKEAAVDIRKQLAHDNPYVAAEAVRVLGRLGDVESAPAIRRLLAHEDLELRKAACDALSRLEGAAAKAAILEAFKDPQLTPTAALVRVGAKEATPELARRLRGGDPELLRALAALGAPAPKLPETPESDWRAAEALKIVARAWPRHARGLLPAYEAAKEDYHRQSAARARCEWGEPAGATAELRAQADVSLNALRRPATWVKLRAARVEGDLYATGPVLAARLAAAAGLRFEDLPEGRKSWTGRHLALEGPLDGLDLLDRLQGPAWAILLEDEVLRVVPRAEAVALWQAWPAK